MKLSIEEANHKMLRQRALEENPKLSGGLSGAMSRAQEGGTAWLYMAGALCAAVGGLILVKVLQAQTITSQNSI